MSSSRTLRRLPAAVAASAIVLAACAGDDGGTDDAAAVDAEAADAGADDAEPTADDGTGGEDGVDAATGELAVEALLPTHVDLVGETVLPAAEIETNLLPPVVLDDLTTGRKVNFRNLVPQEKPILMWMWAPF